MGLNLNYTLLKEGSNSYFKIPEYKSYDLSYSIYSEAYMIQQITQFNQIMRESIIELNNLNNIEYVNESEFINNIANTVSNIIRKVVGVIKKVCGIIVSAFKELIKRINEAFNKNKEDKVEQKFRQNERIKILRQALYNNTEADTTLMISDIEPTADLMNKNFPDTSVIGSNLVKMATKALDAYVYKDKYIYGYNKSGTLDPKTIGKDLEASESLADFLEEEKETMLSKMFGRYSYDVSNPVNSSIEVAKKAFGSNDSRPTKLTVDLYLLALDNLTRGKEIVDNIKKDIDSIDKNYNDIIKSLNNAESQIKSNINKNISTGTQENQEITNRIVSSIGRIINTVQQVISANINILKSKELRINRIFDYNTGDSARVKSLAHKLILRQLGMEESTTESSVEITDDVYYARILEEQFESMLVITEEYWLENEYNSTIIQYLAEDETGASQPTATAGTANTAQAKADSIQTTVTSNGSGNIGNTDSKVSGAPQFIDRFNQMFDKFRQTVIETVTKGIDTPFWNRNRGKIKEIQFASTTVSDWRCYDIDKFTRRLNGIKYDDNAEYLNTDADMQNAIYKALDITPKQDDNKTFSAKVSEGFYTNYIQKDKPIPINQAGFRKDQTFKFVDEIIRNGFDGTTFGNIKEDRKFINEQFKSAQQNKQKTADKVEDDKKLNNTTNSTMNNVTGTPASEVGNNMQSQNNSAIEFDDFKFNLAEHFGLVTSEKIININEAPQINVGADAQESQGTSGSGIREANARITRYFKYMTYALSAKMTATWAAYRQFMALYKSLYKKPKNDENNNQQQNQNNQQNNQQQPNQNQQNAEQK